MITGKVRFAYANVHTPAPSMSGGAEKYSICCLVDKRDEATIKEFKEAFETAKAEGKATKWNGKVPPSVKNPLRDGDTERPDRPEFEGMLFFNASTKIKPQIVDENRDPIYFENEFYSGCFGRASISLYPYDTSGSKGVAVGLNNLQKVAEGESLAGTKSAATEFTTDIPDFLK